MNSDKTKRIIKIILMHCLMPLAFFILSFCNIISCFINPTNYGSLAELVSNDIQYVERENGYVHIELIKKREDYNFVYSGRYYFDQMAKYNKKGKEFAYYKNQDVVWNVGGKDTDYQIDYSLGITNASSFKSLDFSFIEGTIDEENYSEESRVSHCVISKGFAGKINSNDDYSSLIGKTLKYLSMEFTIDAIVENTTYANIESTISGDNFIAFRYGRLPSKEADYVYHIYLDKDRYYDNFSIFRIMFSNVYRSINDAYFVLNIHNGDWINADIDWYRMNAKAGIVGENIYPFIIIASSIFLAGLLIGVIAKLIIKCPKGAKSTFYTYILSSFLYFAGLFLFGFIFNCKFIGGIHINIFTSFGSLFSLIYFSLLMVGVSIVFVLFAEKQKPILERKPLVSIIIPVYNGANYLKLSIESALEQSYENIEVVVIDDGSNDKGQTQKIAKSFTDKRVRYFKKKNGGVSSALNYGIDKAEGEYICWLSHDDLLPKEKIEYQLGILQKANDGKIIPYSKNIIIDENGKKAKFKSQFIYRVNKKGGFEPSHYFRLKNIIFSSLLVPANYLKNNKFRMELTYSQDTFAFFEMLKNGYKLKYFEDGYTMYRVHSNQGSFTRVDQIESNVKIMFGYFDDYYKTSKDKRFIKRYLQYVAFKAGRFWAYKDIVHRLIENKKDYTLSSFDVTKAKLTMFFAKHLYKIKGKLLGR